MNSIMNSDNKYMISDNEHGWEDHAERMDRLGEELPSIDLVDVTLITLFGAFLAGILSALIF